MAADSSTSNALQSFLNTYGSSSQSDIDHIPNNNPHCCCGNAACAYLEHNQNALDELERELQTSARLGQALLVRHETYMADAERQRQSMAKHVGELETEKNDLQMKNNNLVQENRDLLDQLEALNNAVSQGDASIAGLETTLQSAQQELQKLAALAARTETLERELAVFEHEQSTWQISLSAKDQAEKTAMRRWHNAERTLAKLQDELERIEKESKEERERHDEIVARMERRHAVEKELVGAADRVKSGTKDPNVVSHFVKDILQDNATLQMGIVELREMLQSSNEEVEKLRDQLVLHQPVEDEEETGEEMPRPLVDRTVSLGDELSKSKGQELHVHHHYHAPPTQRSNSLRRTKKKRSPGSTHLTPSSSGRSTPRSSISLGQGTSAAAILRQTAVSVPAELPGNRRWSSQSYVPGVPVSIPSSPTSTTNRTSSLFDKVFSDAGNESTSPPTSEGEAFSSPYFAPIEARRTSAIRKFHPKGHSRGWGSGPGKQSLDSILDASVEDLPPLEQQTNEYEPIEEEAEPQWEDQTEDVSGPPTSTADDSSHNYSNRPWHRPALRRAASHESLLSVSGMDIHTLKERPSQMLRPNGGLSSGAVISNFQVHAAKPIAGAAFTRSSKSILSGMAADQRKVSAPLPARQPLVKKTSGWFFSRWGATPVASTEQTPSRAGLAPSRRASSITSSNSDKQVTTPKPSQLRPPGINQPGAIIGFFPELKVQHPPVLKTLDQDALTKVLDAGN